MATMKTYLKQQIEYYFSVENLCKDIYMRQQMDKEGYVNLSTLLKFKRTKSLINVAQDVDKKSGSSTKYDDKWSTDLIVDSLNNSEAVEVKKNDNEIKLRKKYDWKNWLNPDLTGKYILLLLLYNICLNLINNNFLNKCIFKFNRF